MNIKPRHAQNGEPIVFATGIANYIVCCDCGLTHLVLLEQVGDAVQVTMYRDDYQTAQEQKQRKTSKKRGE